MKFVNRKSEIVEFDKNKAISACNNCIKKFNYPKEDIERILSNLESVLDDLNKNDLKDPIDRKTTDKLIISVLCNLGKEEAAIEYVKYAEKKRYYRTITKAAVKFVDNYKSSRNNADGTVDDNSNVNSKTIGNVNVEINKKDNIAKNRGMVMNKLNSLYPDFDEKQYLRDLKNHIIYKHDESSSNSGATMPYCVSISMFPFLNGGIKDLGGLSSAPKSLESYCGMFCNMIFAVASEFAGAVATPEFLIYFDYFARLEWGDDYYKNASITRHTAKRTVEEQIIQHFQQVTYAINQPSGGRGAQAIFWNIAAFDKYFFEGLFSDMVYPDLETEPCYDSINYLQKLYIRWLSRERLSVVLTFPVISVSCLTDEDGNYKDEEFFDFVSSELSEEGKNSFFVYNSKSVDSLSSCCRLRNAIDGNEFNFTNGNIGVMTGSKSVITLNVNRIVQDWYNKEYDTTTLEDYIKNILDRVYKYHIAYNECIYDSIDAGFLPVYTSGYIDAGKQFLTIGINGINEAAWFLGFHIDNNDDYKKFCQTILGTIKDYNKENSGIHFGRNVKFNTEFVPAESLAVKNYNWDERDGYRVPKDRNLYGSYIYLQNKKQSILERITMHGADFLTNYTDGGAAAHLNIDKYPTKENVKRILQHASRVGCNYLTFNVLMSQCDDCGFISKTSFDVCPKCGGSHVTDYTRIIGYLTAMKNWSTPRFIDGKNRYYGM